MREIDNKMNTGVNFNGISKTPVDGDEPAELPTSAVQESRPQIDDLSDMPEAFLGQSQVAAPNPTDSDMLEFQKRPDLVAIVDAAVSKYAQTHTEEETLAYLNAAYSEFFK